MSDPYRSLFVIGATTLLGAVYAFKKALLLTRPTLKFAVAVIAFTPL